MTNFELFKISKYSVTINSQFTRNKKNNKYVHQKSKVSKLEVANFPIHGEHRFREEPNISKKNPNDLTFIKPFSYEKRKIGFAFLRKNEKVVSNFSDIPIKDVI